MTPTQSILQRDEYRCGYCSGVAVQRDHYITKNQARRTVRAARERENPRYQVAVCRQDNEAKGTLLRVAERDAHLLDELYEITGSAYGTWDGDPSTLYGG